MNNEGLKAPHLVFGILELAVFIVLPVVFFLPVRLLVLPVLLILLVVLVAVLLVILTVFIVLPVVHLFSLLFNFMVIISSPGRKYSKVFA